MMYQIAKQSVASVAQLNGQRPAVGRVRPDTRALIGRESFGLFCLNPFATDIVFFTLDSCSIGSEDQFLTWWPILTIERFEKFKMAAGGHIGKMKNVRITNDTIFNMFLGSRNQIKMFVLWFEVKFSLQGHLKVI